jgi:hypothetical protein
MTAQADIISSDRAADYIGGTETVCGTVASVSFSAALIGFPTFVSIGGSYPNQDLLVFIWGNQRQGFSEKVGGSEFLAGHRVCVTGSISGWQGRPQIFLQDASQIEKLKDR